MRTWRRCAASSRMAMTRANRPVSVAVSTSSRTTSWRSSFAKTSARASLVARWSCSCSPPEMLSRPTAAPASSGTTPEGSNDSPSWTRPKRVPAMRWKMRVAPASTGAATAAVTSARRCETILCRSSMLELRRSSAPSSRFTRRKFLLGERKGRVWTGGRKLGEPPLFRLLVAQGLLRR